MISGIVALFIEEYVVGMLILSYCQIQLAEAIIWRGIDTDNKELNKIGTLYGKYTLPLHMLAAGIGFLIIKQTNNKRIIIPFIIGLLFYIGVIIFYSFPISIKQNMKDSNDGLSYPSNRSCMKRECQNNENRLQWPFRDEWYILQIILLFSLFIYYLPCKKTIVLVLFFGLTYVISRITYQWSYSSIWCFLSAILSPILVLTLLYIKKYKNSG
jgi:hypothetical protein